MMDDCLFVSRRITIGRTWLIHMVFVAILWITTAQNTSVLGQNSRSAPPTPKSASAALDLEPFDAEALGLKINLPAGSAVAAEKADGQLVITVTDDPTTPTWSLRIQTMISTLEQPTAARQIEELMREYKLLKQDFKTISNTAYTVGPHSGQLCYLRVEPRPDEQVISGWLLVPRGERTFMVFSLQTLPEHLPRVRPLIEASFATIQLRSAEDMASERQALLDSGRALIEACTPEKLKSLVGVKQWHRVFKPAATPGAADTEVGYSLLEVFEAMKGAVEPSKPENQYDRNERKPGLMIRVQSRVVSEDRSVYYDSMGLYWMAWDQSEETWNARGTQWQGEAEWSEAETGLRSPYMPGAPPPRLTVIKTVLATNAREPNDWLVPDVYLSQPLHWLLGRLLPTDIRADREYRYYFYNFASRQAQLSQRSDVWGPLNDGSGNFRLVTKLSVESPAMTAIYNSKGELVRRVHPDGSITEPSTVETIHKLWKNAGLKLSR